MRARWIHDDPQPRHGSIGYTVVATWVPGKYYAVMTSFVEADVHFDVPASFVTTVRPCTKSGFERPEEFLEDPLYEREYGDEEEARRGHKEVVELLAHGELLLGAPDWETFLGGVFGDKLDRRVCDFFTADNLDQLRVTRNLALLTRVCVGEGIRARDAKLATRSMGLLAASMLSANELHKGGQLERFEGWERFAGWFLAAYPDVAMWLQLKKRSELEGMTGTKDLMMQDADGNVVFNFPSLRRFIDAYKQEAGSLETARGTRRRG